MLDSSRDRWYLLGIMLCPAHNDQSKRAGDAAQLLALLYRL
jgi:hypothetical protein